MADDNKLFHVTIISPDRMFYEGEAEMVEFNTTEGEIGIYKNHIPLTTIIAPGILTITNGDEKKLAALHSGFVEVLQDRVTFLAETVEWPDEIDISRAELAKERAEARIAQKESESDVFRAEAALRRALTRIDVKEI